MQICCKLKQILDLFKYNVQLWIILTGMYKLELSIDCKAA